MPLIGTVGKVPAIDDDGNVRQEILIPLITLNSGDTLKVNDKVRVNKQGGGTWPTSNPYTVNIIKVNNISVQQVTGPANADVGWDQSTPIQKGDGVVIEAAESEMPMA